MTKILFFSLFILFLVRSSSSFAGEKLNILFESASPFFQMKGGKLRGENFKRIDKTLKSINIDPHWIATSYKRILLTLASSKEPVCAAAYSITNEREGKYEFSGPLLQIGKSVLLTHKKNVETLNKFPTIKDMILNSKLKGAFINTEDGWHPFVEAIKITKNRHIFYSDGNDFGLNLLSRNRVDFIFLEENAADLYLLDYKDKGMVKIPYPTAKSARNLHLMCSKNINPELLKSFNDEIEYQ